jgi:tetratricopeptide (TPR) repeat protein
MSHEFLNHQADRQFQEALSTFHNGETERAEDLSNEILKEFPNHGNTLNLLGVICLKQGAYPKACQLIQTAMQNFPEKAPIFSYNLALAYTLQGNVQAAIKVYNNAALMFLSRDEKHEALSCLEKAALLLRNNGQLVESKKCYLSILELDPTNLYAYNDLGVIHQLEGNFDEAIQNFSYVIQLDPTYSTSYNNLALVHLTQKNFEQAVSILEQCLEIDPRCLEAHINLSIAYLQQDDLDKSLICAEKARELEENDPGVHNNLGIIFYRQGKLEEAIACYKKALELDPTFENAEKHLQLALQDLEKQHQ